MIWKNKPTLDILNEFSVNTAVAHMGIKFVEVGDDFLKATMPVDYRTVQPMRILHGGASVLLAETLGSIASSFCVENPVQNPPVGIEINANHIKSVKDGMVTGKVTPIRLGRKIHVWQIEITDDSGQLICISRLTVMILNSE